MQLSLDKIRVLGGSLGQVSLNLKAINHNKSSYTKNHSDENFVHLPTELGTQMLSVQRTNSLPWFLRYF